MSEGRTPRAAAREAGLFLAALVPCPVIALAAGGDRTEALARGRAIDHAERALGLPSEPAIHAWASARPGLLAAAWFLYLFAHLPAVGGALTWAWLERPRAYRTARNVFLSAQGLTLTGYLLLPSAPPHLLPELGVGSGARGGSGVAGLLQSPWAALPSGHVVFALVAAGIVVALVGDRRIRGAAALYPVLMLAVTVVTGNHFWTDAIASLLVAAAAAAAVLLPRRALAALRHRSARATVGAAALSRGAAGLGD